MRFARRRFCATVPALDLSRNTTSLQPMAAKKPLRIHVGKSVQRYFKDMGSTEPENLHRLFLAEIEPPLIRETLRFTEGNQSRAARILGITRNTLRTKMKNYGISGK